MTTATFLHGALLYAPLRAAILGWQTEVSAAVLPGFALQAHGPADWPVLVPAESSVVPGAVLADLSPEDLARLDHHAAVLGQHRIALRLAEAPVWAYLPLTASDNSADAITAEQWADRWGQIATATAGDVMALFGTRPGAEIARRYGLMLVRGASRLRAEASTAPTELRRQLAVGDVTVAARREAYANFFSLEEYDLAYRRFDGGMSPVVTRAAFVSGDAVTVLPYDPQRDRVLLVEQFRVGALVRGDSQPWLLEAIAGRIDPGETSEAAARREAVEEAGLTLGKMFAVANYYPSVGAKTEYLYSYVALADLPDGRAGLFGLEGEGEDIRGHLVSFDRLMALVASGEVNNASLILTAWWLALHRDRLRAVA